MQTVSAFFKTAHTFNHEIMKKRPLLILILWFFSLYCLAQNGTPLQLEFPCSQYSTELQCIPCQAQGVCVFYPTQINDSSHIQLAQYNVNLEFVNRCQFAIAPQLSFAASHYSDNCVYLLYQNKNKRHRETEGQLFCYHCDSHQIEATELKSLPINDITQFSVHNGAIYFVSATGRDNTNLFFGANGQPFTKSLFLNNAPDYTIDCYHIDTVNQKVLTCVNTASGTRNNVIWLAELTLQGEPLRIIDLPDTGSVRFQNARIAQMDSSRYLISGTYQIRKGGLNNTASGKYTTIYENGRCSEPQLYPFNSARAASTNAMSNEVLYLTSRTYYDSSRYVTIAESFYPEYRYSTTYSYGVPTSEPIFVGYRFLNAEIHLFNQEDSLIWQYTFPFDNLLVTNLTTHLRADFIGSNMLFYYILNQSMTTMLVDEHLEIIDPIRTSEIFPSNKSNVSSTYTTGITRWYKDYFLLVGCRIPKSGNNKNSKTSYFINKLKYE